MFPVGSITWGHPNLGRGFREHQLNIFALPFLQIGFSFEHKQKLLEEFAQWDAQNIRNSSFSPCPGVRRVRERKPNHPEENNQDKLDPRLVGNHYDSYWQICKAPGCLRRPAPGNQHEEFDFGDDTAADAVAADMNESEEA